MIQEIRIENFKSIKELNVKLRPINVLIGPNGSGKSNFINFFGMVYAINDKQLRAYTADKGGANSILHLGSKNSVFLSGALNFNNVNAYEFTLMPNVQDSFFFAKEISKYYRRPTDLGGVGWSKSDHGTGHVESNLNDDTYIGHYVKKHLESFRVYHFHDTSKNAPLKQSARVEDYLIPRTDGGNLPSFLYQLQKTSPLSYNRIEATIKLVAPYFDRFDLVPNGEFIRLKWRQNNTDMYLDASDLSDGTLRFIALCALFLQPNLPETIIVDEPELGLHPYAINILAGLIKNASEKSQIIVSTQSVSLIDNFEPEDIIVVNNVDNESHFKRLTSEELEIWLAEYSLGELWNKNVLGGNP